MDEKKLGKIIFWAGGILLGIAFVLFMGATPKFMPRRPIGEAWALSLPLAIGGIICIIVGFNLFKRKRR
ncbi:MAG: hypothetical protein M3384_20295 [Acidobacteriota bacterium]|nr:hypothetical protein [Acidobacteriota bacterium]